jgi:signal transduction histidine kinase
VLEFLSHELKRQQIELITDLAPDLPKSMLDHDLFYRALLNILMNSIQAMTENGQLQVSTYRSPSGETELSIRDTGIGMSPEKIEQIFKPFFTDKNKGTGLGLAITKSIIDSHNAEIVVQSEEGKGATFTLILPPA